jgi:hypothetical protein
MDKSKKKLFRPQSYNPLREAAINSPTLTESWLKGGESLSLVQRVGHGLFSMVFIGIGLFLGGSCWDGVQASDFFNVLFFGGASLFFLYFGLRGMRNVFRFRGHETPSGS